MMKRLPIINKPKHPKKGEYKEQKGRTSCPRRQKESPKKVNHKGNIKFPNTLPSQEAYQIGKVISM
jgi:hypothetical protein